MIKLYVVELNPSTWCQACFVLHFDYSASWSLSLVGSDFERSATTKGRDLRYFEIWPVSIQGLTDYEAHLTGLRHKSIPQFKSRGNLKTSTRDFEICPQWWAACLLEMKMKRRVYQSQP